MRKISIKGLVVATRGGWDSRAPKNCKLGPQLLIRLVTKIQLGAMILTCLLVAAGCGRAPGPEAARQQELVRLLKPLQWPGVETEDCQEAPGWYESTNRQALESFIVKHPGSEEADEAEVWLIFALANTESSPIKSEKQRLRAERAHRLAVIHARTNRPATAHMAAFLRVFELFEAEDYDAFERQVDEVLVHIKEFESDKDPQFRCLLELCDLTRRDIEPELRDMLVIEQCYLNRLDQALRLALELKRKFPSWDGQSVDGAITLLKLGQTPYPHFE